MLLLLLLLLKREVTQDRERWRLTSYQYDNPAPRYQPIERNREGASLGQQHIIGSAFKTRQSETNE